METKFKKLMEKEKAVIFDLDLTTLYHTNRSPYDWSDLSGDVLIKSVGELIQSLSMQGYMILLVTGRPERVRPQTKAWLVEKLEDGGLLYDDEYKLFMKQGIDYTKSYLSKEVTLKKLQEEYDILMAFDDDNRCADMYVRNGIITMMPMNYKVPPKKVQQELEFPKE